MDAGRQESVRERYDGTDEAAVVNISLADLREITFWERIVMDTAIGQGAAAMTRDFPSIARLMIDPHQGLELRERLYKMKLHMCFSGFEGTHWLRLVRSQLAYSAEHF